MDKHLIFVWMFFLIGMGMYMLKRAYYLVTGPNPVANSYREFIVRCWIPLLVRVFVDAMAFWILFLPGMADKALVYFGWTDYEWAVFAVTQFPPFAGLCGFAIDAVIDFVITKVPWVKDWLPQMPPPLKALPAPPAPGGD